MKYHPDVSPPSTGKQQQQQRAEKFKRISEAYSILGNENKRKLYDFEVSEGGIQELRKRAAAAARAQGAAGGGSGSFFAATLPRNVLIGTILGVAGVAVARSIVPNKENDDLHHEHTGKKRFVEAWLNPKTKQWEKPKPWDEDYQKLQPVLQFVPRDQVVDSIVDSIGGKRGR